MADILIRGMEMPKDGEMLYINIYPNGKVCISLDLKCEQVATAVPLPEGHGRLVDADKAHSPEDFNNEPTIVPAEGGPDNGN